MKRPALAALAFVIVLVGCVKTRPDEATNDASASSGATPTERPVGHSVEHCESLLIAAERTLAEARAAATVECATSDDCALIESSACTPGCSDRAVAKSALAGYAATRERLRATSCKRWSDGRCAVTTPKPAPICPAVTLACTDGKCVARQKT
jgi:hypothetical protein